MQMARREGRAILTDDRDFGLLVERAPAPTPGIILLRLHPLGRSARATRVAEILNALGDSLRNELVVIEPGQILRRAFRRP
jgi:predicted nuclease of predicted toxin-antitoxin system